MALLQDALTTFRGRRVAFIVVGVLPYAVMLSIVMGVGRVIRTLLQSEARAASFDPAQSWKSMALGPKLLVVLVFVFLIWVPHVAAQAAVTLMAKESRAGRNISIGAVFARLGSHLLTLVPLGFAAGVVVQFGAFLLLIPGLVALAAFSFVAPAAMLEDLGVIGSFRRSIALARGRIINLMGFYLVMGAGALALDMMAMLFVAKLPPAIFLTILAVLSGSLVVLVNLCLATMYVSATSATSPPARPQSNAATAI